MIVCARAAHAAESVEVSKDTPKRLRRKDSYFGVHLDFHASLADKNIGQNTTPDLVNGVIDIINPDYIEIDTKGHPGISSYPTKVGTHGGSFVGDPLKVWREVTAKRGVALYGHHSGVYDDMAIARHPEWAAIDSNGTRNTSKTSIFGPYVDKLFIPQLIELALDYKLDGAWIDGDCWATMVDYSETARKAFIQRTGITVIPTKPGDPMWFEWMQFHRDAFRQYLRHYLFEVKKRAPEFELASNWAFSLLMPEPVTADVKFLSGDISGRNSVNVCRYISRLMASQGIPWDVMSWSFLEWNLGTLDPPATRKPAVQLKREAACVIAQGGGYQAVFSQAGAGTPPLRDGSVDLEKLKPMGEVGKFCRERQEVCFKGKSIPQIAVLCSTEGTYRRWQNGLFCNDTWQYGIVSCLLENQYSVDVLLGATLAKRLKDYPLVVICQWEYIEPDLRDKISDYVKQGGSLLIVGEASIKLFDKELADKTKEVIEVPLPYSLSVYPLGKGQIATIPQTMTTEYAENPSVLLRDLVGKAVSKVFASPLAVVTGSHDIDVSVMRTASGKLAIHLVNTSGPHRTAGLIPKIDPVGPLAIDVRLPVMAKRISREPGNRLCKSEWKNGIAHIEIDEVQLHEIIVIEGP